MTFCSILSKRLDKQLFSGREIVLLRELRMRICFNWIARGGTIISPLTMAAQRRGRFGALANDRNLRRFVVNARPTGRHLGTGSYGAVEEVCSIKREREVR